MEINEPPEPVFDNPDLDNPEPVNLEFDNPEQGQAQPDLRNFDPNHEFMLFMQQQQQQIQQQNQQMQLLIEATLNSHRSTQSKPLIQTYDGTQDYNVYRAQFNVIAQNQNWTDMQKRDELIPKLTGKAAQVLARLVENHDVITYQILDEALVKGCSVRKSQHQKEAEFYTAKQKSDQSEEDFARQVEILGRECFPELSEERIQSQLFKVFVKGLQNTELQAGLKFTPVATLDAALPVSYTHLTLPTNREV